MVSKFYLPSEIFVDGDDDNQDVLTYTVEWVQVNQNSATALPNFITYNKDYDSFDIHPTSVSNEGIYKIRATASDDFSAEKSTEFEI